MSILVRSVKQEQTHMCILIQCMINVHWVVGRFTRCRQEIRPRKDTDWLQHWLESIKLLHNPFKPRNPGSRILPTSFHAVSNSSPPFSEHPFPKGSVQTTVTCTYMWNSLPFVPSTFCAEDALQQPSHWFYKCCLEIQAEPLLSQMVGNLVLQVILFFLKSQFQDHSAWLYRVGREGWVETIFPTPTSRETSSFPWKAPAPQQTNNKYSFTKMISLTSVSNTLYTILV